MHITNIIALCFIILAILDRYNPMMQFLNNTFAKRLLVIFAIVSVVSNLLALWLKKPKKRQERKEI